jgi:fermentation-respiration switch protein FrsA (DUF1100 family)
VGVSLGSCVAALAGAFEPLIRRCALLLTAGDFAEVVWTGRATSHIRAALTGHISVDQLREAWSIISPLSYLDRLSSAGTKLLIISGRRDQVVLFSLAKTFVDGLRSKGCKVTWRTLPCGHYLVGKFPYSVITFALTAKFLS